MTMTDSERWLDSGSILKIQWTGFSGKLDTAEERKGGGCKDSGGANGE